MNLVDRVKKLLVAPTKEWAVIAGEPATVAGLYTHYVLPLAAIPAISAFIGFSIVGYSGLGSGPSYRIPIPSGVAVMVLGYVLSLSSVYVLALVINAFAPRFGVEQDFTRAFKVAAYFPTAYWLSGVFSIFPELTIIGLVAGFYSLWLLYTGLPAVMEVREDRAAGYAAVVVVAAMVLVIAIAIVSALAMPARTRGF